MKVLVNTATAVALVISAPAFALQEAAPASIVATAVAVPANQTTLPTNTELLLSMNEELTTKGKALEVGHKFGMSVVHDVRIGDYVVIPKGTPAFGEVTWLTSKGAFGKSGKMEIELRYVELNGRRIPITGKYRQEGEGNTVATVGTVIVAGVFAAFVTGKSARIPQGRELKAFTTEALAVALPAGANPTAPAIQAVSAPVAAPAVIPASAPAAAPVVVPATAPAPTPL